jgi:hypothetical protein
MSLSSSLFIAFNKFVKNKNLCFFPYLLDSSNSASTTSSCAPDFAPPPEGGGGVCVPADAF